MSCTNRHGGDEACLGEPLCPDCYDYTGSVLFNATAPELWRRLTMALRRHLAKLAGLTQKDVTAQLVVSFAKVPAYGADLPGCCAGARSSTPGRSHCTVS
ncbi:replication initiator [Microbispora siamensis]